jgi:hypothetical protein
MTEQNKQPPAESGEGVAEVRYTSHPGKDCIIVWIGEGKPEIGDKLYTSQTAATQAAVAAAMRKCAELVRTQVVWNESVAPDCFAEAILASIPAEANAALEKMLMEVAKQASDYVLFMKDGGISGTHEADLRAIVTYVIEKGK